MQQMGRQGLPAGVVPCECGAEAVVLETRLAVNGKALRRRHRCLAGHTFTTYQIRIPTGTGLRVRKAIAAAAAAA